MTISILLIDDHITCRRGLRAFLESRSTLHIVGEGCEGKEALLLAERLQPDVVVMDNRMPGLNGIEATRQLRNQWPDIHVVMLSLDYEEVDVLSAIQNGANGYVLKEDAIVHLEQAVAAAAAGEYYFSPSLRKWVDRIDLIHPVASDRMDTENDA